MKATTVAEAMAVKELRSCKRGANGVVQATQLRFTRLTNQAPSQCVAASHSDFEPQLDTDEDRKNQVKFKQMVFQPIRVHPCPPKAFGVVKVCAGQIQARQS
jgi:hypothetical protein